MTTLLIDGDPIAYQCAFANESRIDWGDGDPTITYDPDAALADVEAEIEKIKGDLGVRKVVVALSVATHTGWRRPILPTYKANRAKAVKPLALEACRQVLMEKFKAYLRPTLEADDVLGILATHRTLVRGEKIIVSIDKDLRQVPGRVYNPRTQEMVEVSEEDGDYLHMLQTLSGDPVDGYTGIPGVGPAKAAKILGERDVPLLQWWAHVVAAYEAKGMTEDDALVQARVARICRAEDYNFKKKEVRLWTPPSLS